MNKASIWLSVLACVAVLLYSSPSRAQVNLGGDWRAIDNQGQRQFGQGPFPVDYVGIPLNAQGRAAGLRANPDNYEELNKQCQPWIINYIVTGNHHLVITPLWDRNTGTVAGWRVFRTGIGRIFAIWVDGRPSPPANALHTWNGFTTGTWRGDTLVTITSHLKDGVLYRNYLPSSNRERFVMFITRHGDLLTITGIVHDPVYLAAPWPLAETWRLWPGGAVPEQAFNQQNCTPANVVPGLSDGQHFSTYLIGQNPNLTYMTRHYNIPVTAALGGAQTMYPQYRKKLQGKYKKPTKYCTQYCCPRAFGVAPLCKTPGTGVGKLGG